MKSSNSNIEVQPSTSLVSLFPISTLRYRSANIEFIIEVNLDGLEMN